MKEIDLELEIIKQKAAYFAEEILKKMFPENYKEDSVIKILIDLSSDPIEIVTITDGSPTTEGKIGKIEITRGAVEGGYSVVSIMTIWAKPFEKPSISILRNK